MPVRISRQTTSSTWRCVGPVTIAFARVRVSTHQSTIRAVVQSLPEPLQPTTVTRRLPITASRISICLSYGSPASPSTSRMNARGSSAYVEKSRASMSLRPISDLE